MGSNVSSGFVISAAAALLLTVGSAAADTPAQTYEPGQAYAKFVLASYDSDGDGAITQHEFDKTGKANFNDIDRDANGIASIKEIAAWYIRYLRK